MKATIKMNRKRIQFPKHLDNDKMVEWVNENLSTYETVAELEFDTDSIERTLDVCYTWTQNECSEKGWVQTALDYQDNTAFVEEERSTNSGDIFKIENTDWLVIPSGFLELIKD
jgi:hypothetical protein